jgi:hypothetical protein
VPVSDGDPTGEVLRLPAAYGSPSRVLEWADVSARLEQAPQYWLTTVRSDGRPHTVPIDALWLEDACWFGGSPETLWQRNLQSDRRVTLHLPDAVAAVIVEGECELVRPDRAWADALVAASNAKYGYAPPVSAYLGGVWRLPPTKVFAWSSLPEDATRFRIGAGP